jgi:F420H2 dehydrogenase subunit F
MVPDAEGFFVPHVLTEKCVDCGLCSKVCPVMTDVVNDRLTEPLVYACYNEDEKIRRLSSSGGLFSAIASLFNDEKSCVVAAALDKHLELRHCVAKSEKDIAKMRGSKYVQSNVGDIYIQVKEKLKEGKRVLFVGTPCQIAGLYGYLRNPYENLYTVDLICHGVPSPMLFREYLHKIGIDTRKKYRDYYFRDYQSSGCFVSSVVYKWGWKKKIPVDNHSYITAYLKGWLHRKSCYYCKFATIPRQGDCTIGDFWGIISSKVSFSSKNEDGVSVFLANSDKGKALINLIKDSLYYEVKSLDEAIIDNHNLILPDKMPKEREYIYSDLLNMQPKDFMAKYNLFLPHESFKQGLKRKVKRIVRYNR